MSKSFKVGRPVIIGTYAKKRQTRTLDAASVGSVKIIGRDTFKKAAKTASQALEQTIRANTVANRRLVDGKPDRKR
ncbi:hypothetical protein [Enterovirga sp. CN4-39]|uniref:hypothetical protein n=1 Tax=Enterovirga sp. CN4-39 TaxID=3400910 RepID=UPI003C099311